MNAARPSTFLLRSLFFLNLLFVLAVTGQAQNRVLELDGNGSHVELPPNILNALEIEPRR